MTRFHLARVEAVELIDQGGHAPELLAGNLADMRRANRWAGGVALTLRALGRSVGNVPPRAPLTLLDVATGSADIPRAVAAWAQRRGISAHIIATDISPQIVRIAREQGTGNRRQGTGDRGQGTGVRNSKLKTQNSKLTFAVADGLALPLPDASVDVAMCSFALHHLEPAAAVALLRELRRVARRAVIVNDLVRWRPGYWGTWLFTRLVSRNPLTRHDGPLSVLRAYTRAEMRALAARAGLRAIHFDSFLGYRVAMTADRDMGQKSVVSSQKTMTGQATV